jgi:hypothetical protein
MVLLNREIGFLSFKKWRVTADFLDRHDRKDTDIDCAHTHPIAPPSAPASGRVNHPSKSLLPRFALGESF